MTLVTPLGMESNFNNCIEVSKVVISSANNYLIVLKHIFELVVRAKVRGDVRKNLPCKIFWCGQMV